MLRTETHDTHDNAFAIGWDHARHGLAPPLERLCINPRLRDGFRAGRAASARVAPAAPAVQCWLRLRLPALAEGRAFETVRLTPGYLARLAVSHCPVTREPLGESARFARLRNDAGYAAGNVALLGARAAAALDGLDASAALAALAKGAPPAAQAGLTLPQRRRLAMLASFARPLAHARVAALPLLLLPPPGAMLFNPAQALQVSIARAWVGATPNRRLAALRAALPAAARDAFDALVAAFHERITAGERPGGVPHWRVEDAWEDAALLRRWHHFALALTPAECEALVLHHEPASTLQRPDGLATDGGALARGGLAPLARRSPLRPPARVAGAWPTRDAVVPPRPPARPASAQQSLFTH
jgi:hypothetical protein